MSLKKFVVCLVVAVAAIGAAHGFVLDIDPRSEECFYENVLQDQNVHVVFHVLEGGDMDIGFEVTDPDKQTLIAEPGKFEGKYDFKAAKAGYYRICFKNDMTTFSRKQISMDINVGDGVRTAFNPNKDALSPLEDQIVALSDGIQTIKEDQEYILMRDIAHKNSKK